MELPHNVCICSFEELGLPIRNNILSKLKPTDMVSFITTQVKSPVDPISYLENLVSHEDLTYQPFAHTYKLLPQEAIEFYYKLMCLAKYKQEFEIAHNTFFDYVIFLDPDMEFFPEKVDSITIPSYIDTNAIYADMWYERKDPRINTGMFLCDTITFNTISNFFKFLKKTDGRFFHEDVTQEYFFYNCVRMSGIDINGVTE